MKACKKRENKCNLGSNISHHFWKENERKERALFSSFFSFHFLLSLENSQIQTH